MLLGSSLVISACASVQLPEIRPGVTLPASKDGFRVNTIKEEEETIPAVDWKKKLDTEPYIIIFSEDWATMKFVLLKNCLTMECKQTVGTLDYLFETVDSALKKKNALLKKK